MNDIHEVISAFLDNERINAHELTEALADPDGRALLIDLIALRHLTQSEATAAVSTPNLRTRRFSLRDMAAVAAVLLALAGGYLVGDRRHEPTAAAAPAPTRVVQTQSVWQDVVPGRMP